MFETTGGERSGSVDMMKPWWVHSDDTYEGCPKGKDGHELACRTAYWSEDVDKEIANLEGRIQEALRLCNVIVDPDRGYPPPQRVVEIRDVLLGQK